MQTLGEFLKEYEANGGTYPMKVTNPRYGDGWFEVVVAPREKAAVGYTNTGAPVLHGIDVPAQNWRLWTPPKIVRKEKRYVFRDMVTHALYARKSLEIPDGRWLERASIMDYETEIEE